LAVNITVSVMDVYCKDIGIVQVKK
jgi:hypothetical protein